MWHYIEFGCVLALFVCASVAAAKTDHRVNYLSGKLHNASLQKPQIEAHASQPQRQQPHASRFTRSLIFPPTAPTRLQFIGGIGIPVEDLHFESVTSGYVLKAEYFLPERSETLTHVYLKPQKINGRDMHGSAASGESNNSSASYDDVVVDDADDIANDVDEADYNNYSDYRASMKGGNKTRVEGPQQVGNFKSQHKNASIYRWIIYRGIEMLLERAGLPGRSCMLRSICEHAAVPLSHENGLLAEILHIIMRPSSSNDAYGKHNDRDYRLAEQMGRNGSDCEQCYALCSKSPIDLISTIFQLD